MNKISEALAKEKLEILKINDEKFLKIENSDAIRSFFMSIVSASNHWMFISSNGGLTAGRKNAEYSLFPYYTDDKVTESAHITGHKAIFKVHQQDKIHFWEPFSTRYANQYQLTRNLYKNIYGNKIIFEEINHSLNLTYSYQWCSSDAFGFIKKSKLTNNADQPVKLECVDGMQNILPASVVSDLQIQSSNLVDAYKRNELESETGLGIYALSAVPVDKAEPSEALKSNVVWSLNVDNPTYLVSSLQLEDFRNNQPLKQEEDVKAEKGAYFVHQALELDCKSSKNWQFIADVNYNHAKVFKLKDDIESRSNLSKQIDEDIEKGTKNLIKLDAAADGLQYSSDQLRDIRHYSNTMYNIMRGGIFDDNYNIEANDFKKYIKTANVNLFKKYGKHIDALGNKFSLTDLKSLAADESDEDFIRLCLEYLPLKFSRRHGDPSRPWNQFSINTKDEDGNKILDYEGNWRDIFQNWESLAYSYPEFVESMIYKFLNASTFDGYNPYRLTKDGFDWEVIEPDDPWSYIGYWGDHQIIYLLKFLELLENYKPHQLAKLFNSNVFVYANVPYKIKSYHDILNDPKDTIEFDHNQDKSIRDKRAKLGADGALLQDVKGNILHVNFLEKILATTLAKLSNFIPEAGIWMNTQRPEWNDANNALVGNGVSMVTLYYLRRFLAFFDDVCTDIGDDEKYDVSEELHDMFSAIHQTFDQHKNVLNSDISDEKRKTILDGLAKPASKFRTHIYTNGFSGKKVQLHSKDIKSFIKVSLAFLEQSITVNKREDNLYHAYNLMTVKDDNKVEISYLEEMLEGQVAVLSSKYLASDESAKLLDALKNSDLFRPDQYSYLLYPNKKLKGFLDRNNIPENLVKTSNLLTRLVDDQNKTILEKDVKGNYHFNGNFNNAKDLKEALHQLKDTKYADLVNKDYQKVLDVFEEVFNHKSFTGRSGTFYGYEGLGSIYWHMVSKLQLAVLETCIKAYDDNADASHIGHLLEHYYEINEGIGVHKSPQLYGAFSTDPYSHTPYGKGAQQPGMTGQVKEDILSRFGELGIFIEDGKLKFKPYLLRKNEFLSEDKTFSYVDIDGNFKTINISGNSLCFTFCQIPVIYTIADADQTKVILKDQSISTFDKTEIEQEMSNDIFKRTGAVDHIKVYINETVLK
jgi:hypothetical protein